MEMKLTKPERADSRGGSALIMVVVLTVLLAVIGVLFVMAARIDEMATSSVVYDHELDHAVDSVVALISQRLTDDLTGAGQEPWDYPDINDSWLGVIEPVSLGDNGTPGDYTDDVFVWRRVSDLTGDIQAVGGIGLGLPAAIYVPTDANDVLHVSFLAEASADADGDGVTDSLWIRLPDITTGRGRPVFVAVRIVDNCAMLNLNVAHTLASGSEGRYLSEIDYERFLRGNDATPNVPADPDSIRRARRADGMIDPVDIYHDNAVMFIENPGPDYVLFDISDELEIRNRFLLTSLFEARFERFDVANFTLDAGGGIYGALEIPRRLADPSYGIDRWKWRLDPNNFDDTSGAYGDAVVDYQYKYDRRHVCTFYSFDRNLRLGSYPILDPLLDTLSQAEADFVKEVLGPAPVAVNTNYRSLNYPTYNNVETHMQILKLLYAFRAYYLEKYPTEDFKQAARRAAQIVANMIDYVDDDNPLTEGAFFDPVYGGQTNDNPTYIDRGVIKQLIWDVSGYLSGGLNAIDIDVDTQYDFGIGVTDPTETIYGYERQPFISEIVRYETGGGGPIYYAIELCNPYDFEIPLDGWQLKIGNSVYPLSVALGHVVPAMSTLPTRQLGRLVLLDDVNIYNPGAVVVGMNIPSGEVIELQRPDPADPLGNEFITVDKTKADQADHINGVGEWLVSKRDDTEWKFTNAGSGSYTNDDVQTLGRANAVSLNPEGYQMPVADDNVPIGTLHDFEMVLRVGNEKDPNDNTVTVTEHVAAASDEGYIRTDIAPPRPNFFTPPIYPLDYICFVGRPEGTLPGRINVNTATKEVIRAAIPSDASFVPDYEALAANIVQYRQASPVARLQRITHLLRVPGFNQFATDPNGVGDPDMRGDFEERDWILSQVANKLTVRSDVFTAYILVRLGYDGPERRMIAIFDRSNVYQPIGNNKPEKPRIIALHPVPDPR